MAQLSTHATKAQPVSSANSPSMSMTPVPNTPTTVEGLCLGSKYDKNTISPSTTFRFNTSFYDQNPTDQAGKQGLLTWDLIGGNFVAPSSMALSYNPISNVAVPLFSPGEQGTSVGFDRNNKLYIQGYIDDTVSPPKTNAQKKYYRWYMCNTYVGYSYTTLAWTLGNGVPQNPSCQKVEVVRKLH